MATSNSERQRKWYRLNTQKHRERARDYRKRNPDKIRAQEKRYRDNHPMLALKNRSRHLKSRYGISATEFEQKRRNQNNLCAICSAIMTRPFVGHNHETNQVRDLLCIRCNFGLGSFLESEAFLTKAIVYLRKHKAVITHDRPT